MSTSVSGSWWSRVLAASVVSVLSLSLVVGCADDSEKVEAAAPELAPAEVEEPEAPAVELTKPEDIVISEKGPTVPELGSAEGAKEAVQLYLAALTAGFQAKDSTVIEAMSDADCQSCKENIAKIANVGEMNCRVSPDMTLSLGEALAYPLEDPIGAYGVLVRVDVVNWPDATQLARGQCKESSSTGDPLAFIVRPVETGWILWDYDVLEEQQFQEVWSDMEAL